ncbi:MAG: response regulator [Lachnospiraceae bacterium]|nr:response regulator [Lachnospiraceae bacterium]
MKDRNEIVIVMEEQSYLAALFQAAFEKYEKKVAVVTISKDSVMRMQESASGLLVCTSMELLNKLTSVKILIDQAIKHNIPVFAMGNPEELEVMMASVPVQLIQQQYVRPINMGEMVEDICSKIEGIEKKAKKKILAVDDSGTMLRNVKNLLEDKYQVVLANSGATAIKYLTLNTPDLVLLDYEMPIVDGKQVMQMLREDEEFHSIPIIFLTGKNDAQTVMDVMQLKPDGYLLKTMEPEKLHQAIDEFFEKEE